MAKPLFVQVRYELEEVALRVQDRDIMVAVDYLVSVYCYPGESPTRDHPGCDPEIDVLSCAATCRGEDLDDPTLHYDVVVAAAKSHFAFAIEDTLAFREAAFDQARELLESRRHDLAESRS